MYFTKPIPLYLKNIHRFTSSSWSQTRILVFLAFMAVLSAILQSAGGLIPGIGFIISPFATLPILLGILVSFRYGFFAYVLAICLLIMIEPSELFIFPFTTGLLGLSLGWGFRILNQRLSIVLISGFNLFIGICIPLFLLGFPVFGPAISSTFNVHVLVIILVFSILYSWLWLELSLFFIRRIKKILLPSK